MTTSAALTTASPRWPLARTPRGNLLFGVLAGLAWRIGISPFLARVLFCFGLLAAPDMVGANTYFALALVLPVVDMRQMPKDFQHKVRVPSWIFLAIFLLIVVSPALFVVTLQPAVNDHSTWFSFGAAQELVFGVFVVAVGAILLFGKQRKVSPPEPESSLATSAYGGSAAQPAKFPVLYRSPANVAMRISIAVALLMLPFDAIQNFFIFPLAAGFVVAAALAFSRRQTRKVAIPLATVLVIIAGLAGSTGMQIDSAFSQLYQTSLGIQKSPYLADSFYEYRYIGSKRLPKIDGTPESVFHDATMAFVGGEVTMHVQAPDDNKVILDGRMTAGEIVVRNVDAQGNVISEVSSQSGLWTEKKQTYGTGAKEMHIKVHGGVGRIVLEIDRSEWVGPTCHPSPDQPGSYYCD